MRRASILTLLVSSAVLTWAQNQVATVTSSAPFTLRGAAVTPGQGVPMWPILAGDDVKAGNALTIVTFPDGSVLTLSPGSDAKIDLMNGMPVFQLLSGTAMYALKSIAAVQLMAANQTMTPTGLSGTLTVGGGNKAAGGFWTTGHTVAVIVAAGAAAGIGVGVSAAIAGGPAISASR